MLDVTILKTLHQTETEARKLVEHIKTADVFSPEAACSTEELSKLIERDFLGLSQLSRTKVRQFLEKSSVGETDIKKYRVKMLDCAYVSKVPILNLENFTQFEADYLNVIYGLVRQLFDSSTNVLFMQGIDAYIEQRWQANLKMVQAGAIRDKEMAKTLMMAEEKIRKNYPQLAKKDTLKLVAQMGASHYPERYLDFKPNIEVLLDDVWSKPLMYLNTCVEQNQFEEAKPYLLLELVRSINKEQQLKLTTEKIVSLNFKELSQIVLDYVELAKKNGLWSV